MGNPTQVTPLGLSLSRAADIRLSVGHPSCLSPRAVHRPSTLRVQPWVVQGEAEMAEGCGRIFVQEPGSVHGPTVPTIHIGGGPGRCTPTGRTCRPAAPYPASGPSPADQVQRPVPAHRHPSALERSEPVVVGVAQGAGGLWADGPLLVGDDLRVRRPLPCPTSPPPSAVAGLTTARSRPACGSWIPSRQPSAAWRSDSGERRRGTSRPGDEPDQRITVTRCSLNAAQLEFSTDTYTLAMLPPQLTQWALP